MDERVSCRDRNYKARIDFMKKPREDFHRKWNHYRTIRKKEFMSSCGKQTRCTKGVTVSGVS